MNACVVIPVGAGRHENVAQVLDCLYEQTVQPYLVVVVQDGPMEPVPIHEGLPMLRVAAPKHEPGLEQPRNLGVRAGLEWDTTGKIDYAVFLDSDILVMPDWLEQLEAAAAAAPYPRIVVAPYDWMRAGERAAGGRLLMADPRNAMFSEYGPEHTFRNDLSAGLACFSGNLAWPIDEFRRVGGFWSQIHHGRCEDGELGLRAVAMDVPICLAPAARGWHMHHPVNTGLALERNARDVPMLNERHPWVERGAVFMVDRDGAAFDVDCSICGTTVPTIEWWQHAADAEHGMALEVDS